MKKEEAIDFIVDQLEIGKPLEEICTSLTQQLGAPRELVEKFVGKIHLEYLKELKEIEELEAANPGPAKPALSEETQESETSAEVLESTEKENAGKAVSLFLTGSTDSEPQMEFTTTAPAENLEKTAEQIHEERARLEQFVLNELGRQRKHSDVVVRVCEETGLEWESAQKLVSRIASRNHKKLVRKQNLFVIPLSLIALIVGIGLVIAVLSEISSIGPLLNDQSTLTPGGIQALYGSSRQLVWAFITGFILGIGGLVGLGTAIKNQLA